MKITIYELLGLIKDGKAPKKIKYCGRIYEWENTFLTYITPKNGFMVCLGGGDNEINMFVNAFNDNVEILDEFIDIEAFCTSYSLDYIDYRNIEVLKEYLNKDLQNIFDTLDKLIKNQKKIINKLKEEGK